MVYDTFRARLKERREAAGLTQEELARAAGVGQRYVSALERGANTPPMLEYIARWAALLETNAGYLLGLTDDPGLPPAGALPQPAAEVLRVIRGLPTEAQGDVLAHARVVATAEQRRQALYERFVASLKGLQDAQRAASVAATVADMLEARDFAGLIALAERLEREGDSTEGE